MELKSPISSLFLHAGKDLGFSPNQMPHTVPLLLTGNIEPLVGIGPVQFGMSKTEVIEHIGQPDRIFEGQLTKLNYVPSRGLSFAVDAKLGVQEIGCWSEGMLPSRVTTFAGSTKEGIGIGASQEEIVAAYGQPDKTDTDPRGIVQHLNYNKIRTKFSLKEGKIMSIVLEAPK